jgi:hypothetical protein
MTAAIGRGAAIAGGLTGAAMTGRTRAQSQIPGAQAFRGPAGSFCPFVSKS